MAQRTEDDAAGECSAVADAQRLEVAEHRIAQLQRENAVLQRRVRELQRQGGGSPPNSSGSSGAASHDLLHRIHQHVKAALSEARDTPTILEESSNDRTSGGSSSLNGAPCSSRFARSCEADDVDTAPPADQLVLGSEAAGLATGAQQQVQQGDGGGAAASAELQRDARQASIGVMQETAAVEPQTCRSNTSSPAGKEGEEEAAAAEAHMGPTTSSKPWGMPSSGSRLLGQGFKDDAFVQRARMLLQLGSSTRKQQGPQEVVAAQDSRSNSSGGIQGGVHEGDVAEDKEAASERGFVPNPVDEERVCSATPQRGEDPEAACQGLGRSDSRASSRHSSSSGCGGGEAGQGVADVPAPVLARGGTSSSSRKSEDNAGGPPAWTHEMLADENAMLTEQLQVGSMWHLP